MKTSEIVVGATYSNGKGRTRKVIGEGEYTLYSGQCDHDCVKYEAVCNNTKLNYLPKRVGRMTRAAFARWAKERIS